MRGAQLPLGAPLVATIEASVMPRVPGTLGLSTAVPEDSEGPWVQDPSPVCQQGLGMHSLPGRSAPDNTWPGPAGPGDLEGAASLGPAVRLVFLQLL